MFRDGWTTVITGHTLISRHNATGYRIWRHGTQGLPEPYYLLTRGANVNAGPYMQRFGTLADGQLYVEQNLVVYRPIAPLAPGA